VSRPDDPAGPLWQAEWLLDRGRAAASLALVDGWLAAHPDDPQAWRLRAQGLEASGRQREAVDAARTGVSLAPGDPSSHYVLGGLLKSTGSLMAARASLQEALRLEPTGARHHHLLGQVAQLEGDMAGALALADAGLACQPTHVGCLTLAARALRALGRLEEADTRALQALALDPERPWAQATRGWVQLDRGDTVEAARHFAEALRLAPDLEHAREGLLMARRARLAPYRRWRDLQREVGLLPDAVVGAVGFSYLVRLYLTCCQPASEPPAYFLAGGVACVAAWSLLGLLATPLANLVLRWQPDGPQVLRPHQVRGADRLLVLGAGALGCFALVHPGPGALYGGLALAGLALGSAAVSELRHAADRRHHGLVLGGAGAAAALGGAAAWRGWTSWTTASLVCVAVLLVLAWRAGQATSHADGH